MIVNRINKNIKTGASNGFDSIKKIGFTDKEDDSDLKYQYLGKTTAASNNDFIKYGFSFFCENNLLVNRLDNETLEKTGNTTEYLELLEKSIVPTLTEEEYNELTDVKYFGSTIIDNSVIFTYLDIPNNIRLVRLFDSIQESDLENHTYYDIKFTEEEVNSRKGLCIFINRANNKIKVNLVLKAWMDDLINPMRNIDKFFLKNDYCKNMISQPTITKTLDNYSNYIIDSYSGTLLSNSPKEDSLILNSEKNTSGNYCKEWDKISIYSIGDEVSRGGKLWTSLNNNNRGNIPEISSDWEMSENLTNYYIKNVEILLSSGSGQIYPDNIINLFPNKQSDSFYIKLDPGYYLSGSAKLFDGSGIIIDNDVDIYNNNYELECIKTQDFSNLIAIKDINKFIDSRIEEIEFEVNRKEYNLILSLTSKSIQDFDEKLFNQFFNLKLNNKLISYRSSEDIVIKFNDVDYKEYYLGPDYYIDPITGRKIEVNKVSSEISPFKSKGVREDDGTIIRGDVEGTYDDGKLVMDTITVKDGDELVETVIDYSIKNNTTGLLTNKAKDSDEDGTSDILTNVFSVGINDKLEIISVNKSSSRYAIKSIEDNFGNIIEPFEISEDSITYSITPSEFDEQDLTIEYFINVEVAILTINVVNNTGLNLVFEKSSIKTDEIEVIDGEECLVFRFYEVDKYSNPISLEKTVQVTNVSGLTVDKKTDIIYEIKIPITRLNEGDFLTTIELS